MATEILILTGNEIISNKKLLDRRHLHIKSEVTATERTREKKATSPGKFSNSNLIRIVYRVKGSEQEKYPEPQETTFRDNPRRKKVKPCKVSTRHRRNHVEKAKSNKNKVNSWEVYCAVKVQCQRAHRSRNRTFCHEASESCMIINLFLLEKLNTNKTALL